MGYIDLKGIDKYYGEKHILKDINLSINRGELISFLGPSGSGKTTLLRIISGLEEVNHGDVAIDGQLANDLSPRDRRVSMIFQDYTLFPSMTVEQNVGFGLKLKKVPANEIADKAAEALEMVNMSKHAAKYPSQLSGGEQQRVALARAIVSEADILLLDEPFSAIDAKLRKSLQYKIREINQKFNLTTLFVTHDQEEAMKISDRIYLLNDGQIVQHGSPHDVYLHPHSEFTASFIGNYNIHHKDDMVLAIRAEALNLMPVEKTNHSTGIAGFISDKILQGNTLRYIVDTATYGKINVDELVNDDAEYSVGDSVSIHFNDDNLICLHNE